MAGRGSPVYFGLETVTNMKPDAEKNRVERIRRLIRLGRKDEAVDEIRYAREEIEDEVLLNALDSLEDEALEE